MDPPYEGLSVKVKAVQRLMAIQPATTTWQANWTHTTTNAAAANQTAAAAQQMAQTPQVFASAMATTSGTGGLTFNPSSVTITPPTFTTQALPPPAKNTVSAKGDPHLVNLYGQRFDLMKEGQHIL